MNQSSVAETASHRPCVSSLLETSLHQYFHDEDYATLVQETQCLCTIKLRLRLCLDVFLGVVARDADLHDFGVAWKGYRKPLFKPVNGRVFALVDELVDIRKDLHERGEELPDDVLSVMTRAELDGTLSHHEVRRLSQQLLVAGHETTASLISLMLYRLTEQPELLVQLRADPDLIPAAVEESLRLDPPVLFVLRNCTRDTELAGESIRAGQRVAVGIASANRDERVFEEPDAFRLDRGLPRHISFSGGAHLCMGAALARLVACEALGSFISLFAPGAVAFVPGFRFEGVPVFLEYGPARLDVQFNRTES